MGLILTTGILFWVVFSILNLLIISVLSDDDFAAGIFFLAIGAGWVAVSDTYSRYGNHIGWLFPAFYVVIGVIWSFIKWYFKLSKRRQRWIEARNKYQDLYGPFNETENGEYSQKFFYFLEDHYKEFIHNNKFKVIPDPNKWQIIRWMVFWPWSLARTLLFDFVQGLYEWLYRIMTHVYVSMAKHMFSDLIK